MPIPRLERSSACCASDRTGIALPRKHAQAYADHLNGVLNQTVTDARLSLIQRPEDDRAFELTRLVAGSSAPLDLHGSGLLLFVRQVIVVEDGHCRVESYGYRMQTDASTKSWLIRWEYIRDPPRPDYAYPQAHLHINAGFPDGSPVSRLHVPTRRVPLELVVWHLIAEWEVNSKTDDWPPALTTSIEGFDQRSTSR